MKRGVIVKVSILMAVMMMFTGIVLNQKQTSVKAGISIPLQAVDNIDNVPYPSTTLVYFRERNSKITTKFTINSPGEVKALFRCGVIVEGRGSTWISRDTNGYDIIGSTSDFSGSESDVSWFLEGGTYYLNCLWSGWQSQEVRIALLYEDSKTQETVPISSIDQNNIIALDQTISGFLSITAPNDYYTFVLKKKANVTIEYSFDASNNSNNDIGYCTLYGEDKLFIADGSYNKAIRGTWNFNYLLEPGTYYLKLNGLYGKTTLSIKPMYYDIKLTPALTKGWTKESMDILIDTSIDYSEILVLNKNVDESLLNNNNVWKGSPDQNIKVDGKTFKVAKNGTYSVRITDKFNNHTIAKIKVTAIDITKPKITGVTNNKAYNKAVTLKWTDKQSGINESKTTLNGKAVKNGTKITAEGKYTLKVTDKIGNVRKVIFYVDYTAPTAGIQNGKTYTNSVTLKFKDNLSGIKKIVIDDVEESSLSTSTMIFSEGKHIVELWDIAGNYSKTVFQIKSAY